MIKTIVASLLTLLSVVPAFALDGARILEQVDRGLNPESYEMYRKLINVEPSGAKKEFTLFSVKKDKDKIAALFLAPASEKGRSTLRLGDNMWPPRRLGILPRHFRSSTRSWCMAIRSHSAWLSSRSTRNLW